MKLKNFIWEYPIKVNHFLLDIYYPYFQSIARNIIELNGMEDKVNEETINDEDENEIQQFIRTEEISTLIEEENAS